MNSHVALYLAEARQAELRSTAAASAASTPSWFGRLSARAGVFCHPRPVAASTTSAAPAVTRASAIVEVTSLSPLQAP